MVQSISASMIQKEINNVKVHINALNRKLELLHYQLRELENGINNDSVNPQLDSWVETIDL